MLNEKCTILKKSDYGYNGETPIVDMLMQKFDGFMSRHFFLPFRWSLPVDDLKALAKEVGVEIKSFSPEKPVLTVFCVPIYVKE